MTLNTVHHESDLLVIGGGIAGLMTAIRAAELGLSVIVADTSNVRYSGAAATVSSPVTTMARELAAPWISPSSTAREVPAAWEEVPMEHPLPV